MHSRKALTSIYLLAQGVDVFDVNRLDRADRRRRGKSDRVDAQAAARAVLSGRARAQAKSKLFPSLAERQRARLPFGSYSFGGTPQDERSGSMS
ncbi:hypothetical protein GCM10010260_30920 [Streptomyces filipinensis]|uniref:Transposase n=1 Tax=Streptomyces filipinensis TaxID=66887 RepID=A0A918IA59_9ACTN|nr:hypothetical protein [Streptomyces filipinensis]GGU93680.1 hypothetical protein GCM10010260_30920 [Streptomyces filipinensis]